MRTTISGKFLCEKNYHKKGENGQLTDEVVHQILVFDGDDAVKIKNVIANGLKFGDDICIPVTVYSGQYGMSLVAVDE